MTIIIEKMILNKHDLKEFISADIAVGYFPKSRIKRLLYTIHGNEQCHAFRYVKCLRYLEYHMNTHHKILSALYHWKLSRLGLRYGIRINRNTVGKGLNIIHLAGGGGCIVNCQSMGEYCSIQSGVVIGVINDSDHAPIIGNNVNFGLGSKAYGKISIGNNVYVLPNAVVTKDVPDNCIVGGVPAKVVKYQEPINYKLI